MTSILEQLVLDGLALNDEVIFAIEGGSFKFTPAEKKPQFIDNPDSDGAVLAYEPQYGNSAFAFSVRIVPQVNMDTALAKWGELQAKLQKASQYRDKGGIPLVWTPAGSTKTYTFYVLLGEISEIPITPSGDLAGWFINSPVIQVKLTCRSFGYLEERVALAEKASATPLQEQVLEGVGGDVPAEGRLIVIEKAAADRRHLEWGIDQNAGTLLLTAASLTVTGFSGAVTTRTGAYSAEKVVRAPAVSMATTMCSTGALSLIGSYRVKTRVYPTSENARFRISYKVGDGPWKSLPVVQAPGYNAFYEIDLGEVSFEEVELGAQRAEVRLEQMSVGAVCENDANYVELIPTTNGYGKARGIQSNNPTQLLLYDEFNQSPTGNLEGKTLGSGTGTWSGVGETGANGLIVNASTHIAQRTHVSDSTSAFALAGTSTPITCSVLAVLSAQAVASGALTVGVIARYVNTEKFLLGAFSLGSGFCKLAVYLFNSGVTSLGNASLGTGGLAATQIALTVAADGTWSAKAGGKSLSGQHSALATGGALASGKVGFYDFYSGSGSNTRTFDNFNVVSAEQAGRVCYAARKVEVRSDDTLRQDSTGVYYGEPSSYRGSRFYVPTGNSRLALKLRRNDIDVEPDSAVTDNQGVEVKVAERFLAPR